MSLAKYNAKRSFNKTPEPKGGKSNDEVLRFVIQKHAASHLHYDFRLEMHGVLKSWAVPKGPSTDPHIKRLAMMVEDHPYDYRNFEGIIPAGEYGGGTVIVWDEGTYQTVDAKGKDKKTQEKELIKQLYGGKLKFVLKGKKLKGEFTLVKAQGRGENGWLLMKADDRYAAETDILLKDKSVISRMTIERVGATSTNIYGNEPSGVKETKVPKTRAKSEVDSVKKGVRKRKLPAKAAALLNKAKAGPFPLKAKPMLATLVKNIGEDTGWIYEVKWDGYRALAMLHEGNIVLKSRNNQPFEVRFAPVYEAVSNWPVNAVVDGEIVVLNEHGVSDFSSLQNWKNDSDGDLIYYVFDLLWYDGYDLCNLTLIERQAILRAIMPNSDIIRLSEPFKAAGTDFMQVAEKFGLEGVMAKRTGSFYYPGKRTDDWRKIKINKREEVIIGGFTRNEDSKKPFSALLVGTYEKGVLKYKGKLGTGFSQKLQEQLMERFQPLIVKESPFAELPDFNKPAPFRTKQANAKAVWLRPELMCKASFAEMTEDGVMRHPSFEGMSDNQPREVGKPKSLAPTATAGERERLAKEKVIVPVAGKANGILLDADEDEQTKTIKGHVLKFNNLNKLYWHEEGVSKRDMINYYHQVAPYILPHLVGRPMSLNRHPNGIKGMSFYQKDVKDKVPGWIDTMPYTTENDRGGRQILVCRDEASLLYMASMGCIEMNPWSSTVDAPEHPDWCVIDLDPDKNTFEQVIKAAQITKQVLDSLDVPSYCKTSGSTGLHIYIPLGAKYTYEQSKEFARIVVTLVHQQIPNFTSLERTVTNRKGKMYLDFLQNRPQATLAAAYSLRPKPGATVSMPLHWDEVKKGMKMKDFTIFNAVERVRSEGDIFKKVLGKGIDMVKVVQKIERF